MIMLHQGPIRRYLAQVRRNNVSQAPGRPVCWPLKLGGLEADPKPRSRSVRQPPERLRRRANTAALQSRHNGLRGVHASCELLLSKARLYTSLDDRSRKLELEC